MIWYTSVSRAWCSSLALVPAQNRANTADKATGLWGQTNLSMGQKLSLRFLSLVLRMMDGSFIDGPEFGFGITDVCVRVPRYRCCVKLHLNLGASHTEGTFGWLNIWNQIWAPTVNASLWSSAAEWRWDSLAFMSLSGHFMSNQTQQLGTKWTASHCTECWRS